MEASADQARGDRPRRPQDTTHHRRTVARHVKTMRNRTEMDLSANNSSSASPGANDGTASNGETSGSSSTTTSPSHKGMRHVALLIETSGSYGRGLLRGVARYNRERGNWSTYFQPHGLGAPPPQWLRTWKGDGVLARVEDKQMAETLRKTGVPVVNLRGKDPALKFPYVG